MLLMVITFFKKLFWKDVLSIDRLNFDMRITNK